MGQNKAHLRLGDKTLIEHVIHVGEQINDRDLFIISNSPDDCVYLSRTIVPDVEAGHGAISGLLTAVHHCANDYVLVMACDMPFVKIELVKQLADLAMTDDHLAVVPTVNGYPQGVLAIYHRECLPFFETAIQQGQRKLSHILEMLGSVQYVDEAIWKTADPDGRSFININTPNDLKHATTLWQASQQDPAGQVQNSK